MIGELGNVIVMSIRRGVPNKVKMKYRNKQKTFLCHIFIDPQDSFYNEFKT